MIMEENSKQNIEGLSKGQRCKLIREQAGLNQSEFGFVVGASKNAVALQRMQFPTGKRRSSSPVRPTGKSFKQFRSYKKDLTKVCSWPF